MNTTNTHDSEDCIRGRRRWFGPAPVRAVVTLLAVVAALFVGCSASDADGDIASHDGGSDEPYGTNDDPAQDQPGGGDSAEEALSDSAGDEARAQATALTPADLGRDIIFRAEIAVEVEDVAAAGRDATQRIEALGGVVFGQNTVLDPSPRTVLTFKVVPAAFDDALEELSGVGALVDQTITADDVTDRVVDLESRVVTAEASVARLREFLTRASTVAEVAALEDQLVARELELESLRGQLRTIRDLVSLATITLTITELVPESADARLEVISGLGSSSADACVGALERETARDDSVVWCVEIENIGEAVLADIELISDSLGLRTRDFTVTEGSLEELAAGAITRVEVVLDVEDGRVRRRDAQFGLGIDVVVSATPIGAPDRAVTAERQVVIVADTDGPQPGFVDGLLGGLEVLDQIVSALLLVVGALLPFVPFAVLGGLVIRSLRRRNQQTPTIEE